MVMARLHIICGNCGCNDLFDLELERDGDDITYMEPEFEGSAVMVCNNCATRHNLKDNANNTILNSNKRG